MSMRESVLFLPYVLDELFYFSEFPNVDRASSECPYQNIRWCNLEKVYLLLLHSRGNVRNDNEKMTYDA